MVQFTTTSLTGGCTDRREVMKKADPRLTLRPDIVQMDPGAATSSERNAVAIRSPARCLDYSVSRTPICILVMDTSENSFFTSEEAPSKISTDASIAPRAQISFSSPILP